MLSARLWLVGLVAIGLVAGVGWCARTPAHRISAAEAVRSNLRITVSTNGTIEPIDDTIVRARLDGRIVAIPEPGTKVERGAVILQLDDGPVSAELSEARSKRLALEDSLRRARDELARVSERAATDERLYEQGALTRSSYQESQAALRAAQAQVEHLEREVPLGVAALDLRINELAAQKEAATVAVAAAGTVYRTEHKPGATVRAGEPVLRIADLERLRVRMNIDQVDLGRVRAGQLVSITSNAYPGRVWSARVSDIVPDVVVKANRAVADSLAPVEPPSEGLVPGMTVDVEVLVEEVAGALQVPARAIFTSAGQPFVYRVEGGRARVTPVSLGRSSATAVEVIEGLDAADLVVMGPANGLRDGDRVDLQREDERGS